MNSKEIIYLLIILYLLIGNVFFALGFYQGRMGKIQEQPVSICTENKTHVYNVIMLRNCLQKLSAQ